MKITVAVRAFFVSALCVASVALAQGYPARPILMMVPLAAGSSLDVMSGQIPLMFSGTNAVVNQVREGKLRGLAVGALTRSPLLPAVPSVAESGLPGYEFVTWMGMFAPLNTPGPAQSLRRAQ